MKQRIASHPTHPGRAALLAAVLFLTLPALTIAGGRVWTSGGPEGGECISLIVHPHEPTTIYSAVRHEGLLRSPDRGGHWTKLGDRVGVLAIDPLHPSIFYLGGSAFRSDPSPVFWKSTDGGVSWQAADAGIGGDKFGRAVLDIAIDPSRASTLYLRANAGIYKSTDGAASWRRLLGEERYILALNPSQPSMLFTASYEGLLRSMDAGETWTRVLDHPFVRTLAFDPASPPTIFLGGYDGGVFRSDDSGFSWRRTTSPPGDVQALVFDPAGSGVLYAATTGAGEFESVEIFRSADAGASWQPLAAGLPPADLRELVASPTGPATLYACTGAGMYRGLDDGARWVPIHRGIHHLDIWHLVVDPMVPSRIYARADLGGMFRSDDGGRSWLPIPNVPVGKVVVHPLFSSILYVLTADGLLRSDDRGITWRETGLAEGASDLLIQPVPARRHMLYALRASSGGWRLLRSGDGGTSWRDLTDRLPASQLRSLTLEPLPSGALYAATDQGVFKSTDRGQSWSGTGSPTSVYTVRVAPGSPSTLYGLADDNGTRSLWVSRDGGDQWELAGAPPDRESGFLTVHPFDPATLYATGNYGRQVYKSRDSGQTWEALGEALSVPSGSLDVAPTRPVTLHVATHGDSVLSYTDLEALPDVPYLESPEVPGYRFQVRITELGRETPGRPESCIAETVCASGSRRGYTEVQLRLIGPLEGRFLALEVVRFTPARVEVWAEQVATGDVRYYDLPPVPRRGRDLGCVVDWHAFRIPGS